MKDRRATAICGSSTFSSSVDLVVSLSLDSRLVRLSPSWRQLSRPLRSAADSRPTAGPTAAVYGKRDEPLDDQESTKVEQFRTKAKKQCPTLGVDRSTRLAFPLPHRSHSLSGWFRLLLRIHRHHGQLSNHE